MEFSQSLEDALHTWALNEQQSVSIGYPKVAAGFGQYRSGYRTSPRIPSQFDIDVLSLVEKGVSQLRRSQSRKPYMCLVEYYGAYPDAPPKQERLKRLYRAINKRAAYRELESAKTYLQGIIDVYKADMA